MNLALAFTRILFAVLCIFFMTTYMISRPEGSLTGNTLIGVLLGGSLISVLIGFDILFRKFNLRSFNVGVIGLFLGYLMGQALVIIFNAILDISSISIHLSPEILEVIKLSLFLFGLYLGTLMTIRSSDELYVSIPFVKFAPTAQKKKDLLIDSSILSDIRMIDLCSTGVFDYYLIIPRFVVKELYAIIETSEEIAKERAKRCLETIKKLEGMQHLGLRYSDNDFPDVKDMTSKLIRLSRLLDCNILTADISRVQMASIEGVRIINIHSLSNALKPLTQTGEFIRIKVQRYGKEPRQGVGYLEDGTMVVINGGGRFLGEVIDAQVLSVKHTSSGRMIFCNALEDNNENDFSEYYENDYDDDDLSH